MGSNISKGKKWKQRNDGGDPNSFSGVQSKFSKAVVAAGFFGYFLQLLEESNKNI